jgi:hypothetical protein
MLQPGPSRFNSSFTFQTASCSSVNQFQQQYQIFSAITGLTRMLAHGTLGCKWLNHKPHQALNRVGNLSAADKMEQAKMSKIDRTTVLEEIVKTRNVLYKRHEQALQVQMPLDPDKIPNISDRARLSGAMSAYATAMLDLDMLYATISRLGE